MYSINSDVLLRFFGTNFLAGHANPLFIRYFRLRCLYRSNCKPFLRTQISQIAMWSHTALPCACKLQYYLWAYRWICHTVSHINLKSVLLTIVLYDRVLYEIIEKRWQHSKLWGPQAHNKTLAMDLCRYYTFFSFLTNIAVAIETNSTWNVEAYELQREGCPCTSAGRVYTRKSRNINPL